MRTKILRYFSACLVAVAMLSTVAFAAKDASKYILATNVSMVTSTPGEIEADCSITAMGIYSDVGIEWIELHKANGELVGKRLWHTDDSDLMGHDTGHHTTSVTWSAESGEQYYVKVCFWAGTLEVAGDVHLMNSVIVTAK